MMALVLSIPIWAGEQTITISRNEGQFSESNGVYYCYKGGIMMTFTSGMNNPSFLVEHQQKTFEVMSVNQTYIIKKIVFHCVDSTTSNNLDCFYWGPKTIFIRKNFYNESAPGDLSTTAYNCTWEGESNHMMFETMAKPVRFGSIEITYEKETGDVFDLVTSMDQIKENEKYVIVSQRASKAMSTSTTNGLNEGTLARTTIGATPVSFVDSTMQQVIVNDEVMILTLERNPSTTSATMRPWMFRYGTNYLRRSSATSGSSAEATAYTYGHNMSLVSYETATDKMYFPFSISLGTNHNALMSFIERGATLETAATSANWAIRYHNGNNHFRVLNYNTSTNTYATNQRVYLYRPSKTYEITTEWTPDNGGYVTLGEGVLDIDGVKTSQQYQTVTFFVGTNEGYGIGTVVATDSLGNEVQLSASTPTALGCSYSFVMPASDVHITVTFTPPHVIHVECDPESGGGFNFSTGAIDINGVTMSNEGNVVTFTVNPYLGYEFTGLTTSDDVTGQPLQLTQNADGSYTFTMPGNDVTLVASFRRVMGELFKLVTSTSQIVEGNTYILVTQNYDKVMKFWGRNEVTFGGTPIIGWAGPASDPKSLVRVDSTACFFRMDNVTTLDNNYKTAYMNTLNGYLDSPNNNMVELSQGMTPTNLATMYVSGTAYASNYLCWFADTLSSASYSIRYDAAGNQFKILRNNVSDERVWLYKLAESFDITTVCNPPQGGDIELTGGVIDNRAQASDTVTFSVTTNPGYTFDGVTVTYSDGTTGTIGVTQGQDGSYSFVMPEGAVTITASFTAIIYNITSTCEPSEGGSVNVNGNGPASTSTVGETVNFRVQPVWGYRIESVVAVNTVTGDTIDLTTVSASDSYNDYTYTMPAANVHITAKFFKNLFMLGTVMGRTDWVPAGPEFHYDSGTQQYWLEVYFKGNNPGLAENMQAYGFFSLATHIDANCNWTDRSVTTGDWDQVSGRLAAVSNNLPVQDGSTGVDLYNDRPDNAFMIPAGAYRITVNKEMTQMSIQKIKAQLTFTPASGATVTSGQEVIIGSDLQSIVHGIAAQYGMTEDNQSFKNSTSNGASWENDNTAVITQVGRTDVLAEANIGYIVVPGTAYYLIEAPAVTYDIDLQLVPAEGGEIYASDENYETITTGAAGEVISVEIYANMGYTLDSISVVNQTTGEITWLYSGDFNDWGDGSYSFEMEMPESAVTVTGYLTLYTPLSFIEQEGTYSGGETVTVGDELIGTWMAKQYVWAKDQGQRSNWFKEVPTDTTIHDYVRDNLKLQRRDWDQSNWVMLDFSQVLPDWETNPASRDIMQRYVDNKIVAGSITGTYECHEFSRPVLGSDDEMRKSQHIIVLDQLPDYVNEPTITASNSLGYPGYQEDPREEKYYENPVNYMYNHYTPTNFIEVNTHEDYILSPEDQDFKAFFMRPKDREVAQVWGVWLGQLSYSDEETWEQRTDDVFEVYEHVDGSPYNMLGFDGAFRVDWRFNRLIDPNAQPGDAPLYGKPGVDNDSQFALVKDQAYLFHIAIEYPTFDNAPRAPRREEAQQPQAATYAPIFYNVYPLDMMSSDSSVTAVKEVRSAAESTIESITYYNLMGQQSKVPFDGINLRVIRYSDGSMTTTKILK